MPVDGETESGTGEDTSIPGQCGDVSDCPSGHECIDEVCTPYGDDYCNGGCCYDDCCYEWANGTDDPQIYGLDGPGTRADMGDFDGDGLDDVIAAGDMTLEYVRGSTRAGYPVLACQSSVALGVPIGAMVVGDFDGDGRADVVVENDGKLLLLLLLTQ